MPGKELFTADTLSRAPVSLTEELTLQNKVETFVNLVVNNSLPASKHRLDEYREAQSKDSVCQQLSEYCRHGWPEKTSVTPEVAPYWKSRGFLSECDGLLLFGHRIVVPKSLQRETLQKIHAGHQGMERCRTRVSTSVWWPGVTTQMSQVVQQCTECAKNSTQSREPLIVSKLPDYPWQVVGTDLFELNGKNYLLTVDYFSRYPEVHELKSTTSASVINHLKSTFSRHGIPEVVRSDNGPQFSSLEFARFSNSFEFQHLTSSPKYPQSNGQVERMVKTVKEMLQKSKDPYVALLSYRATPLPWCKLSPAELSMGRKVRTTVPQTNHHLVPKWPYLDRFREQNRHFKQSQKKNFDKRHRVRNLSRIPDDTEVWVTSEEQPVRGRVMEQANAPRSYVVETPTGQVHRNRSHLTVVPETEPPAQQEPSQPEPPAEPPQEMDAQPPSGNHPSTAVLSPPRTRSRTGTLIRKPQLLWKGRCGKN